MTGPADTVTHRRTLSETRLACLLVSPALAVIGAVAIYPLLSTCWLSLHQKNLKMPWVAERFVGLANYAALAADERFWGALVHTVFFTVVSVGLELALGLAIALALEEVVGRAAAVRGLVRAAILVPWAIPTVVAAVIWLYLVHPTGGILTEALRNLGAPPETTVLLARPATAWTVLIVADVWKTTPFMTLILLAGLQTIPRDLYEAAAVDGAGAWQRFVRVTLPLLRPAILVALTFRTLQAFMVFGHVYTLTGGGPGTATETLALLAYQATLTDMDFGRGAALGVVIFFCGLGFALAYMRALGLRLEKPEET